jgi:hypothetical protein
LLGVVGGDTFVSMVVNVSSFAENSPKVLDDVLDHGETVYLLKDGDHGSANYGGYGSQPEHVS